jgi:hypothetical protein
MSAGFGLRLVMCQTAINAGMAKLATSALVISDFGGGIASVFDRVGRARSFRRWSASFPRLSSLALRFAFSPRSPTPL